MAKRKPPDPLVQRVKDLASVGLSESMAILVRNSDVEVTRQADEREGKKVAHDVARRLDAFSALKNGMAQGCYDAARRFEADVLQRLGLTGSATKTERVDGARGRSDVMFLAGARVVEVSSLLPPRDEWLLVELIAPAVDRGTWRDHVYYVTGEDNIVAQGAVVRAAVVNLRDAYRVLERRMVA